MKNRCKDGLSAHFYDEVEEQAPISVAIKSYVLKGDLASRLNFIENQRKRSKKEWLKSTLNLAFSIVLLGQLLTLCSLICIN